MRSSFSPARHRSNPLREKSGFSRAAALNPAAGESGDLLGERHLSCHGASAVRRRAVAVDNWKKLHGSAGWPLAEPPVNRIDVLANLRR